MNHWEGSKGERGEREKGNGEEGGERGLQNYSGELKWLWLFLFIIVNMHDQRVWKQGFSKVIKPKTYDVVETLS